MADRVDELMDRAEELIDEALAPFVGVLPPELIGALKEKYMFDLIVDPNGRAELRRTLEDAVVEHSGEPGVDDEDARRKGSA